jgi:NADPH2 dehydrogenase
MASESKLFQPLRVGSFEVQNRIVLAPLTRFRADASHVPLPFVSDYYSQRGSSPGTLLISEGTFISPQAGSYAHAPGIYSPAQIAQWKKITDDVHSKGSFIFCQLWGLGRTTDPAVLKEELGDKARVLSASNIPFEGGATPTAMTEEEIWEFIGYYKQAAKNAIEAGFDGVEIHSANGYLIDQFLQDVSNQRTDAWGGSVEKRARFGLEIAKAIVEAIGADKVGIRVSPFSDFQGMKMKDPVPQFSYYAEELKKLKLAYFHVVEARVSANADVEGPVTESIDFLIDIWGKTSPVIVAGGFVTETAYKAVDEKYKDKDILIAFGRYFIANPDLVFRIKNRIPFTPYNRDLFYNKTEEKGYTTWEFSKEWEAQAKL